MSYYFEKTIVDAKDIYTNYLVNTVRPLLYEGFQSMYKSAISMDNTFEKSAKDDPSIKSPGIIKIFQYLLKGLNKLSNSKVNDEYKRIRDGSGCADIFDDLIKAVMKSHIVVLTYNISGKKSDLLTNKMYEKIEPKDFVHRCYTECVSIFYDHPLLFWHGFDEAKIKDNQNIIFELTKTGIKRAIYNSLPMKEILNEFLNNDYLEEQMKANSYINMKDMLQRDLNDTNQNNEYMEPRKIFESDSQSSTDGYLLQLENDVNDISSLLNRKMYDTSDQTVENSIHKMIQDGQTLISNKHEESQPNSQPISQHQDDQKPDNQQSNDQKPDNQQSNDQKSNNQQDAIKQQQFNENIFNNIKKSRSSVDNMFMEEVRKAAKLEELKNANNNELNITKKSQVKEQDNYFDEIMP